MWVRYDETGDKMQVAIHRMEADTCPWQDLLIDPESATSAQPPEDMDNPTGH